MTTFLVFSITAKKEIEMVEVNVLDEPDVITGDEPNLMEFVMPHVKPPYNGKCYVVNKDYVRTFRLRSEVVET